MNNSNSVHRNFPAVYLLAGGLNLYKLDARGGEKGKGGEKRGWAVPINKRHQASPREKIKDTKTEKQADQQGKRQQKFSNFEMNWNYEIETI